MFRTVAPTVAQPGAASHAPQWSARAFGLAPRRLLRLSLNEASFRTRGFAAAAPLKQAALERIGRVFIAGFNAALAADTVDAVLRHLNDASPIERGFAAEGAAMGVAVGDAVLFRPDVLPAYVEATEGDFSYLVHVGVGWSFARIPWRRRRIWASLDPVHRWLAFDGMGFHDTYFHHARILTGWRRRTSGYAARAYDQGIGRGLWFVAGGAPKAAAGMVAELAPSRHPDLWSGLGLAMAYAGPVIAGELDDALASAGPNKANFAQGLAFACAAHAQAGHVPAHTELAARTVWHMGAEALAHFVETTRAGLGAGDRGPNRYEVWRQSVAAAFHAR